MQVIPVRGTYEDQIVKNKFKTLARCNIMHQLQNRIHILYENLHAF